ncbi:MAG: sulfatase family protein [Limisphaerales bacterium]
MKKLFALALLLITFVAHAAKQPNIIIILADDLGYGDLSCYGHPTIRTPNLDRMAAEGMRFTDFYVAATVCTPSRAALITGRLPIRSGMAGGPQKRVIMRDSKRGLPDTEITIAQALKTQGYATQCVGKWHLGHEPQYLPCHRGFDHWFGLRYSNDMEPNEDIPKGGRASMSLPPKQEWWNPTLFRDDKILEQPTQLNQLTRRYTEEAIKFIKSSEKKPFFLYFAHTYPHVPLFASEKFSGKSQRGLYGDVVEELDWSVGQILETLRKEKLADNTFVFFTSDNGPWLIKNLAGGSAGPLRDGKGSSYEGGMREPGIAWWPKHVKPGIVTHELASSLDLFPTIMKVTGTAMPTDRPYDGFDMSGFLFSNGTNQRKVMFYYNGNELYAVRKGPFKAHFITWPGYAKERPVKHETPVLYNVEEDPGEKFDIAAQHPDIIADLNAEAEKHRANVVPGTPQY